MSEHSTDMGSTEIRHDWMQSEVLDLFALPFNDLLFRAHQVHRLYFNPHKVQISTLLSIKTGACPEDCKYCPQSIRYDTGLEPETVIEVESVIQAGLDYYNHNLDTSPEYYKQVIQTRTYEHRLETLENVRAAGLNVCCGGIVGMGETHRDRAELIVQLANLPSHPQSVPINNLVQVPGTPLNGIEPIDPLEFVRTIAVARIVMSKSVVRLSAGRTEMSDEMQALCFFAGANSMFYGDKLLTTDNPAAAQDMALLERLGMQASDADQGARA